MQGMVVKAGNSGKRTNKSYTKRFKSDDDFMVAKQTPFFWVQNS